MGFCRLRHSLRHRRRCNDDATGPNVLITHQAQTSDRDSGFKPLSITRQKLQRAPCRWYFRVRSFLEEGSRLLPIFANAVASPEKLANLEIRPCVAMVDCSAEPYQSVCVVSLVMRNLPDAKDCPRISLACRLSVPMFRLV